MQRSVNKYIKMWLFGDCFSFILFLLLLSYSSFCRSGADWEPMQTQGLAAGSPTIRMGWYTTADVLKGLQPSRRTLFRRNQKEKWRLRVLLSMLTKETCYTCCRWELCHPAVLLCCLSSFLCFLWRTLLTTDFSPLEKLKQLYSSSFPLEFSSGTCAAAGWESLKCPLRSHHKDRERHVGLKSLSRDS